MSLTKKDLKEIGLVVDERIDKKVGPIIDQKLQPIKKSLKEIKSTLDMHIRQTDRQLNYHHRRLVQLEEKTGVNRPPFLSS